MKSVKKQGGIARMLPIFIGMFATSLLSVMYITYMNSVETLERAEQIARQYMLRMEADGYLTTEAGNELVNDLMGIGGDRINLSGTTMGRCEYGTTIKLCISMRLPVETISVLDMFDTGTQIVYKDTFIEKKTTSKN